MARRWQKPKPPDKRKGAPAVAGLFDQPAQPPPPAPTAPHVASDTSRRAADAVAGKAGKRELDVWIWLRQRGPAVAEPGPPDQYRSYGGATDQEIGAHFGWAGDSVRPRRRQLVMLGLVRDSGKRRRTGKPAANGVRGLATVWETITRPLTEQAEP